MLNHADVVIGSLLIWLFLCALIARAAASFHRPPATWFLVAVILSPLLALVLLLVVGDPQAAAALQEKEEEIRRRHPDRKDLRDAAVNETTCPHCGAVVNPITMDGLYSPSAEPWLLICKECHSALEPDV